MDIICAEYNTSDKGRTIEHCYDKYEIIFITGGQGKYNVEGREYEANGGCAFLIRPLTFYKLSINENEAFSFYSVRFSKEAISKNLSVILDRLISDEEIGERFFSRSHFCDHVSSAFERAELAESMRELERNELLGAILSELIVFLSSADSPVANLTDDELGARVVRFLNRNIDKNISLDWLARRFFVSKYHLCRAFKKYSGTSVHSYINHKRIMYAKQLIEAGETASGAAERVGFGDYSAFYRAYVKIVGKSPSKE
jgi:AraC-like DNA-binding protein